MLISYRSDTLELDRYLIDIDPKAFAICLGNITVHGLYEGRIAPSFMFKSR